MRVLARKVLPFPWYKRLNVVVSKNAILYAINNSKVKSS